MSTINRQSMNYLEASSPYFNSNSIRSYDSNCSLPYSASHSSSGQIYTNAAFEHSDSSGVISSPSHDYEDLQSVRTEAKSIFGPRKKTNDAYQPTRSQRVRQITECSDISIASSASCDALPIKEETCLSKLILCLILAVSVAALVLVVLIVSGKLGPKCGCAQENNISAPSTGRSVSVQSLLSRIEHLEKKEKMVELLQAQVSAQKRLINETANKLQNATNRFDEQDVNLRFLLGEINNTLSLKVENVSKLQGPIGPPGFNGSQGAIGPAGPQGFNGSQGAQGSIGPQGFNGSQGLIEPQGHRGVGDFSLCEYKFTKNSRKLEPVKGNNHAASIRVILPEPSDKRIVGVSCATDLAQMYLISSSVNPSTNVRFYYCDCKGHYGSGSTTVQCFMLYWQCPLSP